MSTPMANTPKRRRARRRFDDDFKAQAVRLVLDEGKRVGAVARDLDLTETTLREWVKHADPALAGSTEPGPVIDRPVSVSFCPRLLSPRSPKRRAFTSVARPTVATLGIASCSAMSAD